MTKAINGTLSIERTYPADIKKVWKSLTEPEEMRLWYFYIPEFRPEPGHKFEFIGGTDEIQYNHCCEITQVEPGSKIAYTWKYEGIPGNSEVCFELFPEGNSTRVRMTHAGVDAFARSNPDLHTRNFEEGWNDIMNRMLWEHLEHAPVPFD